MALPDCSRPTSDMTAPRVRDTLLKVLAIQAVALAALWFLQRRYGA